MIDRKAKMDEVETFDYQGWQFVCSGEQLPSGQFHAAVRYKAPLDGRIRTLSFDHEHHATAGRALAHAKELAMKWVRQRGGDGCGED